MLSFPGLEVSKLMLGSIYSGIGNVHGRDADMDAVLITKLRDKLKEVRVNGLSRSTFIQSQSTKLLLQPVSLLNGQLCSFVLWCEGHLQRRSPSSRPHRSFTARIVPCRPGERGRLCAWPVL